MQKSLIALALCTFALGIAEFGMMGILTQVSEGVGVSIVKGGHLISAYSLGVAVGAPLLIIFRKMPLKSLLLLLAGTVVAGNIFTALSPNFVTLLCARFISGLPHGAFFGAGAIVCTELSAKGKGATAVATMVGGMTVANVIGVPAATFVSNVLSWRMAFGIVALFGAGAFTCIKLWVPRLDPLPDTGMKGQFQFLKKAAPWLIYGGVFFGQMSVYCWLSYVDPIMTQEGGFSTSDMTWIMMLVGAGMVFGNAIAGKLADKYSVSTVCGSLALCMVIVMPAIYFTAQVKWLSLPLAFIATAGLFGIGGPLQYLIVKFAKGGEMLGGAGIQIAFNVSNSVAAVLGGTVINMGLGIASPALAGAPLAAIGAVSLFVLHRKYHSQGA